MIRVLIMLGALLTLGCGSAAAPEVDPHQAAADWFDANREYVAGSVLTAALETRTETPILPKWSFS